MTVSRFANDPARGLVPPALCREDSSTRATVFNHRAKFSDGHDPRARSLHPLTSGQFWPKQRTVIRFGFATSRIIRHSRATRRPNHSTRVRARRAMSYQIRWRGVDDISVGTGRSWSLVFAHVQENWLHTRDLHRIFSPCWQPRSLQARTFILLLSNCQQNCQQKAVK